MSKQEKWHHIQVQLSHVIGRSFTCSRKIRKEGKKRRRNKSLNPQDSGKLTFFVKHILWDDCCLVADWFATCSEKTISIILNLPSLLQVPGSAAWHRRCPAPQRPCVSIETPWPWSYSGSNRPLTAGKRYDGGRERCSVSLHLFSSGSLLLEENCLCCKTKFI